MRHIFFTALILFSTTLKAQMPVTQVKTGFTENGIQYFLPRTNLHVVVKTIKTTHVKGELSAYTSLLLRDNSAIQKDTESWELESVDFQPYATADSSKCYNIFFKTKYGLPEITLSSEGTLLAINYEAKEEALLEPASHKELSDTGTREANYRSQAMRNSNSLFKIAQIAADELFDIRDSRMALIKGEADFMPKDGKQLQLMLEQLKEKENQIMRLFYGSERKEAYTFVRDYALPANNLNKDVLFRFSKHYGVVDADDLSGAPIYISTKNLKKDVADKQPMAEKKENKSLYYNVPGMMNIKVFFNHHIIKQKNIATGQSGHVEYLGDELFGKKVYSKIQLSPLTGGILFIQTNEK